MPEGLVHTPGALASSAVGLVQFSEWVRCMDGDSNLLSLFVESLLFVLIHSIANAR